MKKIAFLLLMTVCLSLQAQTIHWITFADTTDPNVGKIDVNTHQILYTRWISSVNAALAPKGYKTQIHDFYGSKTSPENCKSIVQNLICDPEDIVVFYYLGHGGRSMNDTSRYPQMLLAQNYENMCVPLTWVHQELKRKNPRLTLTIGMCCNSYDENLSAKNTIAFGLNNSSASFSNNEIQNIQKLFLGYKGDIIVSSSKPGQSSWGCYKQDFGITDFFSYHLIKQFARMSAQDKDPKWEELLSSISDIVNNETLAASNTSNVRQQTPIYDVNVTSSTVGQDKAPKPAPTPTPSPAPEQNADDDSLEGSVTAIFDMLVNNSVSPQKRIATGEKLKALLAHNAVVRTLGQDTKTVVDRSLATEFIDRLCTSRILLKVSAVEVILNESNEIASIKVREYYRK